VTPGARETRIRRVEQGDVRIGVAVRATEGKANRALLGFLSARLDVPRSRLSIRHGERSRHKVVEVEGLTGEEALRRLVG
jgi:uncharacterized protein YggU (UPF0235/DUF167 family)